MVPKMCLFGRLAIVWLKDILLSGDDMSLSFEVAKVYRQCLSLTYRAKEQDLSDIFEIAD